VIHLHREAFCLLGIGNEDKLLLHHQQLTVATEDQLCLASMHYLRGHYQEATDIYRKLLVTHKEYDALNVYVAMCYYKLDYFDVSNEIVQLYPHPQPLTSQPLSCIK
jgi:intraflagellar transport protein 56